MTRTVIASKAERLVIAGRTAPKLRDGSLRTRTINVVDAGGHVLRHIDAAELARKIHERAGIELDVVPDAKRIIATCEGCGRPFKLPKRGGELGGGRMPRRCPTCRARKQEVCAGIDGKPCPHQSKPGRDAFQPYRIAARGGAPWTCHSCGAKRAKARMTPEQLSAASKLARSRDHRKKKGGVGAP